MLAIDPMTSAADRDEPWACPICGEEFRNSFRGRRHEKSHRTKPCGTCGKQISENGHTQHQRACRKSQAGVQFHVFEARLQDFAAHSIEPARPGLWCVVTADRDAAMMTQEAALRTVFEADGPVFLVPGQMVKPPETADRYRRREVSPAKVPVAPKQRGGFQPVGPTLLSVKQLNR